MKIKLLVIILFVLTVSRIDVFAYRDLTSRDHTVMINALATAGEQPQITLSWSPNDSHRQYEIKRKKATDLAFTTAALATLDSGIYTYTDKTVVLGERYTYQIQALGKAIYSFGNGGANDFKGFGYIESGVEAKEYEVGKVLLLVDSTVYNPLYAQINRLINDMENEGWSVILKLVTRAEQFDGAKVKQVKKIINDEYDKDNKITTIFLLGRVPVPYSGSSNTDGHPDHVGAWPADMYYGDIDNGPWTDMIVNSSAASRAENRNIPGDGKFDLDALKSQNSNNSVEMAVGRVDLFNMPIFHKQGWENPEIELLKAYLNKDHAYRIGGKKDFPKRGVITDNFAANGMPEGFASSGWRNIASLCGNENVSIVPGGSYISALNEGKYLWAYGTGGGSYNSCGGVGVTADFAGKNINAIFTMMFGSYFGDWDNQNNILRAALCSDSSALTCCWDGRPHWYFHEMGMGKPIGKSVLTSQNNYFYYLANLVPYNGNWALYESGATGRNMCFLGDPTLRMDSYETSTVQNASVVQNSKTTVQLKWDAPATSYLYHYNVYMRYDKEKSWTKVNNQPLTETELIVDVNKEGTVYFQIRTGELLSSNTGSYFAQGKAAKLEVKYSSSVSDDKLFSVNAYPNPADKESTISLNLLSTSTIDVEVFNQSGIKIRTLYKGQVSVGQQDFIWNLTDTDNNRVVSGVYFIRVHSADGSLTEKIIVR